MMKTKPVGLYVHIPFCVKKCAYCDFCSKSNLEFEEKQRYIDRLCEEISSYAGDNTAIDSIFFGGGTPSLLSGDEFAGIVKCIRNTFEVLPDAEFTLEANPKTVTRDKLDAYIRMGVNRVSVGLQSIHENELSALGRIHTFQDFLDSYRLIRESGIDNVNVDLMYGIPYQTARSFSETLERVAELSPEHISVYGLIVEEGTPLASSPLLEKLPCEDSECDMYYSACKALASEGYIHYEISNYAKPGKECKHNLKYWRAEEYIGVGISAYSYYRGERFGNSADFSEYFKNFCTNCEGREHVDHDSAAYEYAMLSLRLKDGFSLAEYERRFGRDFRAGKEDIIDKLEKLGLLSVSEGRIALSEQGFYVSNTVLTELL